MGPDQVLVLLNGKRRHGSALIHVNRSVGRGTAGTDMNAIPMGAIKRIEVLRDGASAQYGSDAIAGVINVILKDDYEGGFRTNYGTTYKGDGDQFVASLDKGFNVGQDGTLHATFEYRNRQRTKRAGLSGDVQYRDTNFCTLKGTNNCIIKSKKRDETGFALTNADLTNYGFDPNDVSLADFASLGDPDLKKKTQDYSVPSSLSNLTNTQLEEYAREHGAGTNVILNDPGNKERNFNRRNFRIGDGDSEQFSGALQLRHADRERIRTLLLCRRVEERERDRRLLQAAKKLWKSSRFGLSRWLSSVDQHDDLGFLSRRGSRQRVRQRAQSGSWSGPRRKYVQFQYNELP